MKQTMIGDEADLGVQVYVSLRISSWVGSSAAAAAAAAAVRTKLLVGVPLVTISDYGFLLLLLPSPC